MNGQTRNPMGDDRFDGELRRFLDREAAVIPGAPTRAEMVQRLAPRTGAAGVSRPQAATSWNPQVLRVVIVLALLAALIAGAFFVGSWWTHRRPVVVAPVSVPPAGACPGGVAFEAIQWDVSEGDGRERWRSAQPSGSASVGQGEIAVIVAGREAAGVPAVELVDTARGASCVLTQLPADLGGAALWWSPAGDALAILTGGSVLVWSSIGTTRAIAANDWVDWAPDGSALAVSDADVSILRADGSASRPLLCEVAPGQTPHISDWPAPGSELFCPPVPHIDWSPDASRIAVWGGDRFGPGLFSVASAADRQMHRLQPGLAGDLSIDGWLDAGTLLVNDGTGHYLSMPVDAPETYSRAGEFQAPEGRLAAFSPDLRRIAWSTSEVGGDLFLTTLATGATSTLVHVDTFGADRALYAIEWAPDGRTIAFTMTDNTDVAENGLTVSPGLPGLWIIDVDGSNLREVSTIGPELGGANRSIAWRPAWR